MRGSAVETRCERSPPAIAAAVWPMRSNGNRPTRTTKVEKPASRISTPAITIPSTASRCASCWLLAASEIAATVVPPSSLGCISTR